MGLFVRSLVGVRFFVTVGLIHLYAHKIITFGLFTLDCCLCVAFGNIVASHTKHQLNYLMICCMQNMFSGHKARGSQWFQQSVFSLWCECVKHTSHQHSVINNKCNHRNGKFSSRKMCHLVTFALSLSLMDIISHFHIQIHSIKYQMSIRINWTLHFYWLYLCAKVDLVTVYIRWTFLLIHYID